MSFLESAWKRYFRISGKRSADESIGISSAQKYPVFSLDGSKRLLILPEPNKTKDSLWSFEGMLFRDDETGRSTLWRLFLASVDHSSLHMALSDYSCYSEWARSKDTNLATFSVNLVEDAVIHAKAGIGWPDVLMTQAYASTVAYLRLKRPMYILNEAMRVQTALLMKLIAGGIQGEVPNEMAISIEKIASRLKEQIFTICTSPTTPESGRTRDQVDRMKLEIVEDAYLELGKYGRPPEVAALPHQDHYGECHIFTDLAERVSKKEFESLIGVAYRNLGGKAAQDEPSTAGALSIGSEADNAFSRWEMQDRLQREILNRYLDVVKGSHFRSIDFPPEDYERYLRLRSMLGGPIRRAADQVRMIKNEMQENFRVESGTIDLQEAIQVIASKSQRSDIFISEEPMKKNETWSILIDVSSSTSAIVGQTRSYATCLANVAAIALSEVTGVLCGDGEPWGMYGFGDAFYIIKDFKEGYSSNVKGRIGGIKPRGLTYLPDAINILTRMIKVSSFSERNFMVVVTDGLPSGYSGIENDLEETIDKAEMGGILVLGVGLNSGHLKRFFKQNCVVSNPSNLMSSYVRAYTELSSQA